MDKVHALLLEQLNRENERAKRELLEQQSACNIARKQREDAGIRLYGMQKQVARVQTNMELMNNEREQLLTSRESKETALRESESISIKYRAEHEKLRENVANKKAQLIDLRESLRYMQQSDLELLGEIKKNQLTVSKGNDGSKTLERDKRMCNSYIEHLTENLRSKQDEEQALHLQIEAQQHQTEVEKEILRQILTDVDRLVIEKSNLIQEWKLSLSAIKARDEALGAATSAWKRFQLEIRDSESRLKELQKEISRVQGKNSDLSGEKKQLENVVKSMDRAIETIQREKEMNEGVQDIIRQNLKRIKQDEDIASKEIRTLCNKMDSVNKKIESVLYERHNLEKE